MGCLLCKTSFKYNKLDSSKTKQKKISSDKKYIYYILINITPSYKYYHFIIKNKTTKNEIGKILLTLNHKPRFLNFIYNDIENTLDISFTVKYRLNNAYLYRDIQYKVLISATGKYRVLYYNNDCELEFYNDI